jgi:hypothetical protein
MGRTRGHEIIEPSKQTVMKRLPQDKSQRRAARISHSSPMRPFLIRVPNDMRLDLEIRARRDGVSVSEVIRRAIYEDLGIDSEAEPGVEQQPDDVMRQAVLNRKEHGSS